MFQRKLRATKPYATTTSAAPYREVVVVPGVGRWDVFECPPADPPSADNWIASFRKADDAEDFRRRRVRLPWRITSS
jgi:hypothetical protein